MKRQDVSIYIGDQFRESRRIIYGHPCPEAKEAIMDKNNQVVGYLETDEHYQKRMKALQSKRKG